MLIATRIKVTKFKDVVPVNGTYERVQKVYVTVHTLYVGKVFRQV